MADDTAGQLASARCCSGHQSVLSAHRYASGQHDQLGIAGAARQSAKLPADPLSRTSGRNVRSWYMVSFSVVAS